MKVKDVFLKYDAKVSFPISVEKIRAAGYIPLEYILGMIEELKECEDGRDDKRLQKLVKIAEEIKEEM